MIIDATSKFQSDSLHGDPLHVTAHFLRPLSVGPVKVRVKRLRSGHGFTHLSAELVQANETRVMSHLVYGVIDPGELPAGESFALHAPAPMARWTPFHVPPSRSVLLEWPDTVNFHRQIIMSRDTSVAKRHQKLARAGEGPGGVEDGRWYELRQGERITPTFLPVVCDVFPGLLFEAVHADRLRRNRFPTVTISLEFKAPIPLGTRTVGVFGAGRFIEDPQGRHEFYAEVWTAPTNITDQESDARQLPDNWREGQRCLATAHQMALVINPRAEHKRDDRRKGSVQSRL